MKSIFTDKNQEPKDTALKKALGGTFAFWKELAGFANRSYPGAVNSWHYSGDKYGWSFRISDRRRVIIYLLPRAGFFKAAFVFGQKASDQIFGSAISASIKNELKTAKVYAEGRGIRIDVRDPATMEDIKKLITIKIGN